MELFTKKNFEVRCDMAKKIIFENKCDKCGKPQPKDESKSNGNWDVYKTNQTCECGGKFVTYVNGQKMG